MKNPDYATSCGGCVVSSCWSSSTPGPWAVLSGWACGGSTEGATAPCACAAYHEFTMSITQFIPRHHAFFAELLCSPT